PTPVGCGASTGPPTRRTGSTTTSSTARPASTRSSAGRRPRCTTGCRPGRAAELRLRLARGPGDVGAAHEETRRLRLAEADAFYDGLAPAGATAEQQMVMRQAFAGML